LNRKIKNSAPTLKWNRIFLLSVTISFIVIILLIHFRSSDDIAARDKLISHSLVSYDDYFESRQDWFLNHKRIREHFIKGKTFYELLAEYGISAQNIMLLNKAIKPFFDLSKTKVDQAIDIWLNKKSKRVEKISLHISPDKILHIIRNGHDFFPSLVSPSKITIQTITNGEVYNSFYQSAIDRGIPPEVIMEIADIFAWDIDFLVDIRPEDTFQVILNKYYRKGKCIGHGKVLAVRFVNQKRIHESFYFNDSKDRSGYYDKRGKSLRKAFLKSPLRYRRISSYFSLRRFHPILKIYRPHYGVDYAAPSGTPVESIGDGRVIFIGWKGGYGRYIRIRHNHIYETGYGHLSRFAKGLKKGSRVRQGDVIGYLGSSGLSTGPHLDFSVTKRGRFVNPLRIKSPPAFILSKEGRERFNELVLQMEEIWQKYQISGLYYL
jgi:murein DD-endopeptidase MepM/ murein hydrolase activator NlpD